MEVEDLKGAFEDCEDIIFKKMYLPALEQFCYVIHTDATLSNILHLALEERNKLENVTEAVNSLLTGKVLVYGCDSQEVFEVNDRGYPGIGVSEAEDEKVLRGSNEGFADSIKTNMSLVRKRLRTTDLKIKELVVGKRSRTNVSVLYMKSIARMEIVDKLIQEIQELSVDGVLDSGVVEQLTKKQWKSPFPEVQTTRRPDKAAFGLLEGRIVLLCDNTGVALILPVDFNVLLKAADDYYNSYFMASMGRLIRYGAAFLSVTLPGIYILMTNFHTQTLPTPLLFALQEARRGVPFPAALEILLMELAFELLREAGVRLPDVMGNTIGIVGGLIIGQAAVDANLVSPIVVILVALTALCTFAIPDEELAFACRLLKFLVLIFCAILGLYGFFLSLLLILVHLCSLESYGVPYLMPFVASEYARGENLTDSIVRAPYRFLTKRPFFAKEKQKIRLRHRREK